jgi:ankyrin repeat protein
VRRAPADWLLTAGDLRRALAAIPDDAAVTLRLPSGARLDLDPDPDPDPERAPFFTLRVAPSIPHVFVLEPIVLDASTRALFSAIHAGDPGAVTHALDRGADIEGRDPGFCHDADTPLIVAANVGNDAIVELLLSRGARVNASSESGWTALLRACNGGHLACAKLLLDAGADPALVNDEGYSAADRIPGNLPDLIALLAAAAGKRADDAEGRIG